MNKHCRVLVVGAGSKLGFCIAQSLVGASHSVTATYRTDRPGLRDSITDSGAIPAQLNLRDKQELSHHLDATDAVVFVPILSESARAARLLREDQHAVFFSSNNVAIDSANPLYKKLAQSEEIVRKDAPQAVILRPTMIYGHPSDQNLSRMMRALRRFPIMPCPTTSALQQPVFFRDLAGVAADVLIGTDQKAKTIAVAGPDVLTYKQLFQAIAKAAQTRSLFLPMPIPAAIFVVSLMRRLGVTAPLSLPQLQRANRDKRPCGTAVITTNTTLESGLRELADALWP